MWMVGLSVDEKIKDIVKEELKKQLAGFEERLKEYMAGEFQEIREELSDIHPRTKAIEEDVEKKIDLLVRFRKHTLNQLMAEYESLVSELRSSEKEVDKGISEE